MLAVPLFWRAVYRKVGITPKPVSAIKRSISVFALILFLSMLRDPCHTIASPVTPRQLDVFQSITAGGPTGIDLR